jgi:FHA domain
MPPVNSVPSSDADNEATAELPVLDVAAYESTLSEADAEMAHTDTWVLPSGTFKPAASPPSYDLDHSGTHEMPAMMPAKSKPKPKGRSENKPATRTNKPAPEAAAVAAAAPASAAPTAALPSSPPLIEELRGAQARAERRIVELEERIRIADAERAVALGRANAECEQLRQQLAVHLETLSTARQRLGVQVTDEVELQDAHARRGDRIATLERELEAVRAQLVASQQRGETLDCDGQNLRATVARRNAQIQMLEADMAARQQREAALVTRLEEALASVDPNVTALRQAIGAREDKLAELKAELELARGQVREKNGDLEAAEESIRQLEGELRDKSHKLEEASVTVEEWRAVIAESQRSILQRDSRIQQLETDLQQHRFSSTLDTAARTGEEPALEGPARVLIRTDGNTEFVHVLGRRTRIGRGSDNELVLDTKHVSRYHAVLLAGPVNTSIEDLNSTNGVFVNGKRVTRQVLQDGDRVMVGKTQFRFTVRD